MEIILLAFVMMVATLILGSKIFGFKRLLKHQVLTDIVCTVGFPCLFYGSFSGMAVAILSGLFISIFLWAVGSLVTLKVS